MYDVLCTSAVVLVGGAPPPPVSLVGRAPPPPVSLVGGGPPPPVSLVGGGPPPPDDEGTFEVVEELAFEEVVDEGPPVPPLDAFARLACIVEDAAREAGAGPLALRSLRALLGVERLEGVRTDERASAWRGVLSGESDDLSACGPLALDEWCADLVARAMEDGRQAPRLKRELRARGVAAFGLTLDEAAA
jgi:hypothetical protein